MENLLENLNPKQLEAVQSTEGPLLILAGAGSGKTRVITYRIAHLIKNQEVSPFRILAVTFTNKAANEMKSRLKVLLPDLIDRNLWVATFHATCAKVLRRHLNKLDYPYTGLDNNFTIYDTDEQLTLIKEIFKQLDYGNYQHNPRSVLGAISSAKNDLISPKLYKEHALSPIEGIVSEVYPLYLKGLAENNALDFDDLLLLTVELFKQKSDILKYYQDKFQYIHVDEYQDTNECQYKLTSQLSGEKQNLCVVGDDDQSIYSFRGADIRNILDFEEDYPQTKVLRLEQNYRSTQCILEASWNVIKNNSDRKEKKLWTNNRFGSKLICYEASDETDEANYVGTKIKELLDDGITRSDIAIFYRTNAQSRTFEEALLAANIPYQIIGGLGFYSRKEIKDLLGYLRVINNKADSINLKRIINTPRRGLGGTTLARLSVYAEQNEITLFQSLERSEEIESIKKNTQLKIKKFLQILTRFSAEDQPSVVLDFVLARTGYLENLRKEKTIEAQTRIENIEELINAIQDYEDNHDPTSLSDYLENVALSSDLDQLDPSEMDLLPLMTLHSAKGLEFKYVFLVGMEEGLLPHGRSLDIKEELEEERRLCYVGITRAIDQLYLVHSQLRRTYGNPAYQTPSRFLSEIPKDYLKKVDRYRSPFL